MKSVFRFGTVVFLLFNLSSCYTTRVTVGEGPIGKSPNAVVYSKAKQFYLIEGIFPIGGKSPLIPADRNCQVKTYTSGFDTVLTTITCGILSSRTTKILVAK